MMPYPTILAKEEPDTPTTIPCGKNASGWKVVCHE